MTLEEAHRWIDTFVQLSVLGGIVYNGIRSHLNSRQLSDIGVKTNKMQAHLETTTKALAHTQEEAR